MLKLESIWMQIADENGEEKEILRGIDLEFEQGKLYAITGPNGGGKTSLAKVIMGIYQPSQGKIYFNGEDISDYSITERAHRGIAYAFQAPPRFKGLTIKDVLHIAAPQAESLQQRKYLRDVGLCPEDYLDRDLGPGLSGGEIKRIEMAQLLLRDNKLTIFDEPEAGVDLWTIQKLISLLLGSYKNNPNKTAVIITHNEKILPICDEVIVIEGGVVAGRGGPSEIWHLIKDDIECKVRNQCQGEMIYEIK